MDGIDGMDFMDWLDCAEVSELGFGPLGPYSPSRPRLATSPDPDCYGICGGTAGHCQFFTARVILGPELKIALAQEIFIIQF